MRSSFAPQLPGLLLLMKVQQNDQIDPLVPPLFPQERKNRSHARPAFHALEHHPSHPPALPVKIVQLVNELTERIHDSEVQPEVFDVFLENQAGRTSCREKQDRTSLNIYPSFATV